jgi:translation initiation factor 5
LLQFVLCGSCKNPETVYTITKSEDVIRDCKACGARSPVDLRHKLTTYIVKNPPPAPKKVKGLKTGAEVSTAANAEAINGTSSSKKDGSDGDEAEDGADGQANVEVDESEIPDIDGRPDGDDDDWAVSPEAVKARERELSAQLKSSMILGGQEGDEGGDDDEDGDSPYGQLKAWIEEQKSEGGGKGLDEKSVYGKAKELGIEKKHKAVLVISESLFGEDVLAEIPRYTSMLQKVRSHLRFCLPPSSSSDV